MSLRPPEPGATQKLRICSWCTSGRRPNSRITRPIGVMTTKNTTPMKMGVVTFEISVRESHPRALQRSQLRRDCQRRQDKQALPARR